MLASALSTYLLHSYCHPFLFFASILIVLYLVDLYNLLSISILFEFAFPPRYPTLFSLPVITVMFASNASRLCTETHARTT